jgi:hypothetical protein
MDDDIKAWLAKFRAEISLQIDKVLDRQSLTLAEVKSLEARMEANFRSAQAAVTHYEDRTDRLDARIRRLEGLDDD